MELRISITAAGGAKESWRTVIGRVGAIQVNWEEPGSHNDVQ